MSHTFNISPILPTHLALLWWCTIHQCYCTFFLCYTSSGKRYIWSESLVSVEWSCLKWHLCCTPKFELVPCQRCGAYKKPCIYWEYHAMKKCLPTEKISGRFLCYIFFFIHAWQSLPASREYASFSGEEKRGPENEVKTFGVISFA